MWAAVRLAVWAPVALALRGVPVRRVVPLRRTVPCAVSIPLSLQEPLETLGRLFVPPPPTFAIATIEGADLYRSLGVEPGADYETIKTQVDLLKIKYADDRKKLVKIEMTKDKINDLVLKQRYAGQLEMESSAEEEVDEFSSKTKNKQLAAAYAKYAPKFLRRVPRMWKPFWEIDSKVSGEKAKKMAKGHVTVASGYMAAASFIALFLPSLMGSAQFIAPLIFFAHLLARGTTPLVRDSSGNVGEVRELNFGEVGWTAAILFAHALVFRIGLSPLATRMPLLKPKQVRFLIGVFASFAADLLWQPHITGAGGNKGPRIKRDWQTPPAGGDLGGGGGKDDGKYKGGRGRGGPKPKQP